MHEQTGRILFATAPLPLPLRIREWEQLQLRKIRDAQCTELRRSTLPDAAALTLFEPSQRIASLIMKTDLKISLQAI